MGEKLGDIAVEELAVAGDRVTLESNADFDVLHVEKDGIDDGNGPHV